MNALLDIRYYNGSTFTDNKVALGQPAFNTASITLDTPDFIYIGYYKPVNQLYMDITTPNTTASTTSLEYWDGSAWTAIQDIDGTLGLTRSGLIQWEALSDWAATTVDSTSKFWVRISTDTIHTAAVYNFIGLTFSDDNDLLMQIPYILDSSMLSGEASHFKYHIAARDRIVQRLTNKGYTKTDSSGDLQSITAWDLLDTGEVRQAATQMALHLIYFNASDSLEDHWMEKADKFLQSYESLITMARLSIDVDDDGIKDDTENKARSYQTRMYK
jgi:hypothetical protein